MKKLKFLLFLFILVLLVNNVNNTYSRYASSASGDVDLSVAKWKVLVNNTDITTSSSSTLTVSPVIDSNSNVKSGTIAPGSTGYFDVEIDPTNIETSFTYTLTFGYATGSLLTDINITGYSITNASEIAAGTTLTKVNYNGTSITNNMLFNNSTTNFKFSTFIIRVYFEWDDSSSNSMDDSEDTVVGYKAANGQTSDIGFKLTATLSFSQYLG